MPPQKRRLGQRAEEEAALPRRKTLGQHIRFWFNATAIAVLLAAYPVMIVGGFATMLALTAWAKSRAQVESGQRAAYGGYPVGAA